MSITPFHFVCYCEERLRAQFEILDPALGGFVHILRRFSLTSGQARLIFGGAPAAGSELEPYVSLEVQAVPQKEAQTALNCTLECSAQKMSKTFRLLLNNIEESETQILKILDFLQKAFLPLGYTTHIPVVAAPPQEVAMAAAMAASHAQTAQATQVEAEGNIAVVEEEHTLKDGNKYILEKPTGKGGAVRMKTHDGKYVPDGALPATLRINDTDDPPPATTTEPKTE